MTTSNAEQPVRPGGSGPSADELFRDAEPVRSAEDLAREGVLTEGEVRRAVHAPPRRSSAERVLSGPVAGLAGNVLSGVDRGAGVNIRELIERLTAVAAELPAGADSDVRVHLCRGHDEPGEITTKVTVDSDGTRVLVQGHPHLDVGDTEVLPVALGVDDELARLVAGEVSAPPPPTHATITTGDGWGYRMPVDADGKAIAPGSLDAIARGCVCDPGRNNDGDGHESNGGRIFIFNNQCPVHRRTKLDE